MTKQYERTQLANGPLVLTERMPDIRSASVGVWVRSGSMHETPAEMGISHLLEHMVFKGTPRRGPREIALALERLGGVLDAYTTREHTSFQARVLDEHVDIALDVLADIVSRPLLREEDLRLEREVVLEEIATVEDTPDDLVFDLHAEQLWNGHPYGYSILGTRESVCALDAAALRDRHSREYGAANLVVAAAGAVDHETFVAHVAARFDGAGSGGPRPPEPSPPRSEGGRRTVERDSAQTHVVMGCTTFGHGDPRRYALILLSTALGAGMSSRLFQRVREDLGLAYSVHTYQSFYRCSGVAGVYFGTRPEWADRAEDVVFEELGDVAARGLIPDELDDAKGQVKGQVVLSLESSIARLHRLAGTALFDEPYRSMEEILAAVDAVTADEVAAVAAEYFAPARQAVLRLGPAA